jgi:hypothetical protein
VDKARKDIEAKENDLRTRERLLSATQKTQLQRDIDDAKRVFDRKNQDYQKELNDLQNDLLAPIAAKAQDTLAAFVSEQGYTLLLDLSAMNTNVVWANQANNITDRVLKAINDAYKKAGSSAAPATAPAANAPKPPATAPSTAAPARSTTPATPATPPPAPSRD